VGCLCYRIDYTPDAPKLEILDPRHSGLLNFDGNKKAGKWPAGGLNLKPATFSDDLFQFFWLAPGVLVYREQVIEKCDDFY